MEHPHSTHTAAVSLSSLDDTPPYPGRWHGNICRLSEGLSSPRDQTRNEPNDLEEANHHPGKEEVGSPGEDYTVENCSPSAPLFCIYATEIT